MESFGRRLKEFRKAAGLTQEQLGNQTGIGKLTISGYEIGRREPNFDNLVAIARALSVSTDQLLGNSDAPPAFLRRILRRAGYEIIDKSDGMLQLITPELLLGTTDDGALSMAFAKLSSRLAFDVPADELPDFVTGLLQIGAPEFIDARIKVARARQQPIPFLRQDE